MLLHAPGRLQHAIMIHIILYEMTRLVNINGSSTYKHLHFFLSSISKKISILLIDRNDCERVFNIIYEPLLNYVA